MRDSLNTIHFWGGKWSGDKNQQRQPYTCFSFLKNRHVCAMNSLSINLELDESDCQSGVLLVRFQMPFDPADVLSVMVFCDNR